MSLILHHVKQKQATTNLPFIMQDANQTQSLSIDYEN